MAPAFSGSRLVFNFDANELLAQKEMRQAIYHALDSQEMIDKLASGVGEVSNAGILPPAHIMYNPDVIQYDYNLEQADALLDELGYSEVGEDGIRVNENGERLSFELLASSSDSSLLFVEQMARAGIEFVVTVHRVEDLRTKGCRFGIRGGDCRTCWFGRRRRLLKRTLRRR